MRTPWSVFASNARRMSAAAATNSKQASGRIIRAPCLFRSLNERSRVPAEFATEPALIVQDDRLSLVQRIDSEAIGI
jgi:hypothetical protein